MIKLPVVFNPIELIAMVCLLTIQVYKTSRYLLILQNIAANFLFKSSKPFIARHFVFPIFRRWRMCVSFSNYQYARWPKE